MIEQLRHKPFFTTAEAHNLGVSTRMLSYWVSKGKIERLQRGVYRFIEGTSTLDPRWVDLYRAAIANSGVVCLLSALDIYGLTDEFVDEHWIAIENQRGQLHQPGVRFVRVRDVQFEQKKKSIDAFSLPIFSVERTLVDSFRLLDKETALKALKGYCQGQAGTPNYSKLHLCAKRLHMDIQPYLESMMA